MPEIIQPKTDIKALALQKSRELDFFLPHWHIYPVISGYLSPRHGASSGCGWRNSLQYGRYLRTFWIRSRGQPIRCGPPGWGLGELLTIPHRKNV